MRAFPPVLIIALLVSFKPEGIAQDGRFREKLLERRERHADHWERRHAQRPAGAIEAGRSRQGAKMPGHSHQPQRV